MIKICAYVDPAGFNNIDEYNKILTYFNRIIKQSINFSSEVYPRDLPPGVDIYVIDYGGYDSVVPGISRTLSRELHDVIIDRPNCLFIFWTSFTCHCYLDYIFNELDYDIKSLYNVIIIDDSRSKNCVEFKKIIKKWIKDK